MTTKRKIVSLFLMALILNACGKEAEVDLTKKKNSEYNYVDTVKQDISKLVSKEKYEEATIKVKEINKDLSTVEGIAIRNYITIKRLGYTDSVFINSMLGSVPEDYKGTFAEEILKLKSENIEVITEEKKLDADANAYAVKPEPTIGMTKNEVRESEWGVPNDINTTITTYGEREQWVYYGNRYIYFEDGLVTVIQK